MPASRLTGRSYGEVFGVYEIDGEPPAGPSGPAGSTRSALHEALGLFLRETPDAVPVGAVLFGDPGAGQAPGDSLDDPLGDAAVPAVCVGDQYPWDRPGPAVGVRGVVPGPGCEIGRPVPGSTAIRTEQGTQLVLSVGRPDGATFGAQAADVFDRLAQALAAAGLEARHLVRTWYFIGDIDAHYAEFNRIRDTRFDRWGLRRYPASTGIGAALPAGVHISVMAEATDAAGPAVPVFDTALQPPPTTYGSRFVRANEVVCGGIRTVHISGISNIGADGRSIAGAVDDLVDHTMASFLDLLETAGMTADDVRSAYVYCKGDAARDAFERRFRARGLSFPTLLNHVDVCRPDLVFEIEGRAVRAVGATGTAGGPS